MLTGTPCPECLSGDLVFVVVWGDTACRRCGQKVSERLTRKEIRACMKERRRLAAEEAAKEEDS
jgi:hypothetical protein